MIQGASQADIAVLIISARKGEFETGFERGGQTREHAQLARTLGVEKIIVAVNKMDDPSVEWSEERFNDIKGKLSSFMKPPQYKDVTFLPMSGLTADNMQERKGTPAWWTGPTLFEVLNTTPIPNRDATKAFRIPMIEGYKDMGSVIAVGKVEQGTVRPGTKCLIQPIGHKCTIASVMIDDEEVRFATCGENISLKVVGASEEDLRKGYVLCPLIDPARAVTKFKAKIQVLDLPEERPVLTAGYKAVIHCHVAIEECEILKMYESVDPKTKPPKKVKNPSYVREGMVLECSISLNRTLAVDTKDGAQQLSRFTLRDEGMTIAIGTITELPKEK
jgi:peptide chain release factor subunit 3